MAFWKIMAVASFLEGRRQAARARAAGRRMESLTREQMEENRKFRDEQLQLLDIEREKYREMVFVNPFENMENPFEDLTVNTQQAEFLARRGEQTRANLLSSLRSAAGGSGIAALAQTLANQGMLQQQKIAATIGKQETANRLAMAKGEMQANMAERKGEAMVQGLEAQKQTNLLTMQGSIVGQAAANLGQSQANNLAAVSSMAQIQASNSAALQSSLMDMAKMFKE
jgi:hypothetical protein|tara:strand:- start:721 stop:1401 length:681 start_codon:yes stop_codon:yes gene_type:complete